MATASTVIFEAPLGHLEPWAGPLSSGALGEAARRAKVAKPAKAAKPAKTAAVIPLPGFTEAEQKALRVATMCDPGPPLHTDVLTGNFDGFGLLQWNTRDGTLQHWLTEFMKAHPARFKAVFGPDAAAMSRALKQPKQQQLAFFNLIRTFVSMGPLKPWAGHLRRLGADSEFQAIQVREAQTAMAIARVQAGMLGLTSERGLACVFDVMMSRGYYWLEDGRFERIQGRVAADGAKMKKRAKINIRVPLTELQLLAVTVQAIGMGSSGTCWVHGDTDPFLLIAVERPGGGPITDKHDAAPQSLEKLPIDGGKSVILHTLALQAWAALVAEATAAGIPQKHLLLVLGYRSLKDQKKLFDAAVKRTGSPAKARFLVGGPPGDANYQSGRAVDFHLGADHVSANVALLRQTAAHKWLVANAVRYGFYPHTAAPWHWEYNPPAKI